MNKHMINLFCVLISSNFMLQSASAARATAESSQLRREKPERIHIVWTAPENPDTDAIITCIGFTGYPGSGTTIGSVAYEFHRNMYCYRRLPIRGTMFVSDDFLPDPLCSVRSVTNYTGGVIGSIVVSSYMTDPIRSAMEAVVPSLDDAGRFFYTEEGHARMKTYVQQILQHGLERYRTMTAESTSYVCTDDVK